MNDDVTPAVPGEAGEPELVDADAAARARKRAVGLLVAAVLLLLLAVVVFLDRGDWIYLLGVGGLSAAMGVKAIREIRSPDALLRPRERELVERVIARHEDDGEGGAAVGEPASLVRLMALQDEVDGILETGRDRTARFFRHWGTWAAVAVWFVFAAVYGLFHGLGPGALVTVFGPMAVYFGALAGLRRREQLERDRAIDLLEDEIEEIRRRLPPGGGGESAPTAGSG